MGITWFYFDILISKNANSATTILIPNTKLALYVVMNFAILFMYGNCFTIINYNTKMYFYYTSITSNSVPPQLLKK